MAPLVIAAAASFVAAVTHALVVPEHLQEYSAFGVFFAFVAIAQAAWSFLILTRRERQIAVVGLALNGGLLLLWAVTRTVGLPIGPEPWAPEPVGAADLVAVTAEAVAVAALLRSDPSPDRVRLSR